MHIYTHTQKYTQKILAHIYIYSSLIQYNLLKKKKNAFNKKLLKKQNIKWKLNYNECHLIYFINYEKIFIRKIK